LLGLGVVQVAVTLLVLMLSSFVHVFLKRVNVWVLVVVIGDGVIVLIFLAVLDGTVYVSELLIVDVTSKVEVVVDVITGVVVMLKVTTGVIVLVTWGPQSKYRSNKRVNTADMNI
jgi:hypothetical protein